MPSGGSFVHVPCLSEREPAIQEGRIRTPQSNSVETKSREEQTQAVIPDYVPSIDAVVLKQKSLIPFFFSGESALQDSYKHVSVCVCAFVPCALVCACVCVREPQVVEWECSWQEKVSAEVVSLSTLCQSAPVSSSLDAVSEAAWRCVCVRLQL